jgi:hypothetical protein
MMQFFKDLNGHVCAYDSEQIAMGYPLTPMTAMSAEEVGAYINPPKTAEQLEAEALARFISALESHYDTAAQSRRYDNRLTCALRAGYPGHFQAEGLAFAVWMDECNAYAYGQMALVQAGEREQPTPDELVAELPPMVWP